MDVMNRITQLMEERGWGSYKLAKQSGLAISTIANLYRRHTTPSLETLQTLCDAFGITLSQFFAEDEEAVPLTPEQKHFFDLWANLTPEQKDLIEKLIHELR